MNRRTANHLQVLAERAVFRDLTDAGVLVRSMGTDRGVTWVEVLLDGRAVRFESEWQSNSVAKTIGIDLLDQIKTRRPKRFLV